MFEPRTQWDVQGECEMKSVESDALVFFGATGDLAYEQIFPALHAMTRRGQLELPIIGVGRSAKDIEELRARARESVEKHGGVDERHLQPFPQNSSMSKAITVHRRHSASCAKSWERHLILFITSRYLQTHLASWPKVWPAQDATRERG
jgi:glucose-6-phosphate 1-dehydrogenase